jgi:hypothetical protein
MRRLVCCLTVLAIVGVATAEANRYPGRAQRHFRGKTYIFHQFQYGCPIWYAGNGIVRVRKEAGVPISPYYAYDQVVR